MYLACVEEKGKYDYLQSQKHGNFLFPPILLWNMLTEKTIRRNCYSLG